LVAYLEEEEDIENPNTLRYFVITAASFLEYNDVEISPLNNARYESDKVIVVGSVATTNTSN
jgi:hypothetical protein